MAKLPPTEDDLLDLPDEVWQPTADPVWWRQWLSGWRLVVVLGILAAGYVVWRGPSDYRAAKAWRGRGLVVRAGVAAAEGKVDDARRLFDQAGVLAPSDPVVLRAIADFAEPREDVMALYALRQLQATGRADALDLERLARLAFDWGRPELAPVEALREWAAQPADGLDPGRLESGARWLAGRGLIAEAEARLRRALETAVTGDRPADARRINLALARLLASDATGVVTPARMEEAVVRWLAIGGDPSAPVRQVVEAMDAAVAVVVRGVGTPELNDSLVALLRETVAYRVDTTPPPGRAPLRLSLASLDLHLRPLDRGGVVGDLVIDARSGLETEALRTARWLVGRRYFNEARSIAEDRLAVAPAAVDWFVLRIEALLGQREWEGVRLALEAGDQPLPHIRRELLLYRLARAAEVEGKELESRRTGLREAARVASAPDVIQVAGHLEAAGDRPLAMEFYRQVQRHEQVGLAARLGLVRCLHQELGDAAELIDTLESLLVLWPDSNEARGDLAYLRLLPPTPPRPDDLEAAQRLVDEAPQFLAFRMVAALAALRDNRAADALEVSGGEAVPWNRVRPGWRAVQSSVLAANGRMDDARTLAATVPVAALRPGERELLEKFSLSPGP